MTTGINRSSIIIALVIISLILLLSYTYLQYINILNENERLKEKTEKLKKDIELLTQKIENIENDKSTLSNQLEFLRQQYIQLEEKHQELQNENQLLRDIVEMKKRETIIKDYTLVIPPATNITMSTEAFVLGPPQYAGYYYIEIVSTGRLDLTVIVNWNTYTYIIEYEITGSNNYIIPVVPGAAVTLNFTNKDITSGHTVTFTIIYFY